MVRLLKVFLNNTLNIGRCISLRDRVEAFTQTASYSYRHSATQDLRTDKETKTVRQTDQSKLRGIQSECSIKCFPLKWNTEPSPGEVNVDWNKEHDPIVTCFTINRVNLLYACSDRIYTVFHNRALENTAQVSTLFYHNTCNPDTNRFMEAFSHHDKSFNLGDHATCYM